MNIMNPVHRRQQAVPAVDDRPIRRQPRACFRPTTFSIGWPSEYDPSGFAA